MPARSPSQTTFDYSPTSRSHHTNPTSPAPLHPHFANSRPPQPPTSPGTGSSSTAPGLPPISSTLFNPREPTNSSTPSKYYDPTLDHGDRSAAANGSRYPPSFASQVSRPSPSSLMPSMMAMKTSEADPLNQQNRDGYHYPDGRPSEPLHQPFQPTAAPSYAHTSPPHPPASHAPSSAYPPVSPNMNHNRGSTSVAPPSAGKDRPTSQGVRIQSRCLLLVERV
jgi:chromatin-remodeling ATPase INO80